MKHDGEERCGIPCPIPSMTLLTMTQNLQIPDSKIRSFNLDGLGGVLFCT